MAESQATAATSGGRARSETSPAWVDTVFVGLIIYVAIAAIWMLTGLGGEKVTHWIGLLGDLPSSFCSVLYSVAAARRAPRGALRMAWIWLSIALTLYFTGSSMDIVSDATICVVGFGTFFWFLALKAAKKRRSGGPA